MAAALFELDFLPQAQHVLMANARHTYDNALGTVTELFSGHQNTWPQEGVPHQGFSSTGIVLPLVRGLLGLDGNAIEKRAAFRPGFPPGWPAVSVSNWRIGEARLDIEFARSKDRIVLRVRSEKAEGFRFLFAPGLGLGARPAGASANGRPLEFAAEEPPYAQSLRPRLEFPLTGDDTVELRFTPGPEIVLPDIVSATGDTSAGPRLIRSRLSGRELVLSLEGPAGGSFTIGVLNGDRVDAATGAVFDGRTLTVAFPPSARPYVEAELTLRLK